MRRVIVLLIACMLVFSGCGSTAQSESTAGTTGVTECSILGQWFVRRGSETGNYYIFREDGFVIRFSEYRTDKYLSFGVNENDDMTPFTSLFTWYQSGDEYYFKTNNTELAERFDIPKYKHELIRLDGDELTIGADGDNPNVCERVPKDDWIDPADISCSLGGTSLSLETLYTLNKMAME